MPLYEYRCQDCGERFELIRRYQDADRDLGCPHCQSERVQRQISSFFSRFGLGANCGANRGLT